MNVATFAMTTAITRDDSSADDLSAALAIRLLGAFRVTAAGIGVPAAKWRLRKARQLVALLALAPAHRLHREQVMDTLWPDLEPEAAANNLHYTLHVARRILDPENAATGRLLRLHGGQVVLQPNGRLWTDVFAFEAAAMAARASGEPSEYRQALSLYRGDLLPEDPYEDWAVERRQFLRETYLALLFDLAGEIEGRGELDAAAEILRQLVEADSAHEPAHAALMRLYTRLGRRAQALRQYQQLRDVLARELDVAPDPSTEALHAAILDGRLPADPPASEPMPAIATPSTTRTSDAAHDPCAAHNLPAPLTSFIGRERELTGIHGALDAARLVTLTGPGGSGKTRLAIEVGWARLAGQRDGVWLVELADLRDPALVPRALAAALRVEEQPGRALVATLCDALRDRRALIVLDNCEHLLHGCAQVMARLLAACPELCVLATSREPLHISGELIWPVLPLAAPVLGRLPPLWSLQHVEAVRLFVDRARLCQPGFVLWEENAGAVAGICARLAGLPLAIELAANWTRMFSAEQINTLLSNDLRLLLDDRGTHERQRGLRATVERSYDLLTPAEQALFRRLSVFSGGATLAAAAAVCCSDDDPCLPCRPGAGEQAVLVALAALVDKNLLRQEELGGGEPRFTMLETIRAYGMLRLEESDEAERVRERHARWYLGLAEAWHAATRGHSSADSLDRLHRERDNLRAALGWATSRSEEALGLRLATALYGFWYIRGPLSEGFTWLERALARSEDAPAKLRIQARYMAGELARVQGDYRQATILGERSLCEARQADDTPGIARALFLLANIADSTGDHPRAITLHEQSLALYRSVGDKDRIAMGLTNLGDAIRVTGDVERAIPMFEEALGIWRELGSTWGASIALLNLAESARQTGKRGAAARLARESLSLSRQLDDRWGVADCFDTLAEIAIESAQPERAARLLGAAEALRGEVGVGAFADSRAQAARVTFAARAALGAAPFTELRAEGRALQIDTAFGLALNED
jgi:predicted ATPase/DNA-binding SARP family transcriptional activator